MKVTINKLQGLLYECDEAEQAAIPSDHVIVLLQSSARNKETYRLWPGGPTGHVLEEIPPYIVVSFAISELRPWAVKKLIELKEQENL